ncbi:uncharacterized protein [Diadema antillarum]|uniref:uncharacterized protein n=1 Tax=Diadema antillarum TaxID=105358 RepID=UPI003A8A6671
MGCSLIGFFLGLALSSSALGYQATTNDGIPMIADEFLLVTDYNLRGVFASNFRDFDFVRLPLPDVGNILCSTFDTVHRLVFWTQRGTPSGSIHRAHPDGSDPVTIASSGLDWPFGVAVDPEKKLVYWSDTATDKLERANYDGSDRIVLLRQPRKHPFGLVLDFERRMMYWADEQHIRKMSMDDATRQPEILVRRTDGRIRGLAMNEDGSRLYWGHAVRDQVESVSLPSGEDRQLLLTMDKLVGMTVYKHDVIITNYVENKLIFLNEKTLTHRSVGVGIFDEPYDTKAIFTKHDPTNWSCSFDDRGYDLCGWSQSYHDNFDWTRLSLLQDEVWTNRSAPEPQAMFVGSQDRSVGEKTELISPFTYVQGVARLQFEYLLFSSSPLATLQLSFHQSSGNSSVLWSGIGSEEYAWREAVVDIHGPMEGHFHFSGVVGLPETEIMGVDTVRFISVSQQPSDTVSPVVRLTCDGSMTVLLEKRTYGVSSPNQIRFVNSSCYGYDYDNDFFAISTAFDSCRTTRKEDGENFYFSNVIEGLVSSVPEVTVNCTVSRRSYVHTSFRIHSTVSVVSEAAGNFTISLSRYDGSSFSAALNESSDAPQIEEGQTVFLGTSIASVNSLSIVNERCWRTPSADPADTLNTDLVVGGEPAAEDVSVFSTNTATIQGFSFEADKFVNELTYIHCNVLVCDRTDSPNSCDVADTIVQSSRQRRASRGAREDSARGLIVSRGPYYFNHRGDDSSAVNPAQGMSLSTSALAAIATVINVMVVSILLLVIAVIAMARRLKERR